MTTTAFSDLGIGPSLCRVLDDIGFIEPSPIQAKAIPELLDGRDLLGIAQTGTGKTAAFSLPILQMLKDSGAKAASRRPKVLILAPTRELAAQIRDEIERFSSGSNLRLTCIFGGVGQNPQVNALKRGVELLVATPGRLLDLLNQSLLSLGDVTHLVLDEADRLLDMGFVRDVRKIVAHLPDERQSLLFSATMPKEVAELAADILNNPVRIDIAPKQVAVERIEQGVLYLEKAQKQTALEKLLFDPDVTRAIVFTRTKHGADRVVKKLLKSGIESAAIHGNKSQNARTRALGDFRSGKTWVLVATDIAARGIDIEGISHVINFELPHEPESYVHRIGRTARAGADGIAWSLVEPDENKRLRAIEKLTKVKLKTMDIGLPNASPPAESSEAPPRAEKTDASPARKRRRRRNRPNKRRVA